MSVISLTITSLVAIEVNRDEVVATGGAVSSADRGEGERVNFVLVIDELDLSIRHQIENYNHAARSVCHDRLRRVHY